MDLITLNEQHQQEKLIENYDSLIWAERYNTVGDFQLITGSVDKFMQLLPEGKMVSLRESNVPMVVERHLIERKKNDPVKLTIKGRALESTLDRRVALPAVAANQPDWVVVAKIPSDVAHYVIYKIVVEGLLDPKDVFPPDKFQLLTPSDYLSTSGPNRQYSVPKGNLLTGVQQLIQTAAKADPTTTPPSPEVVPHGIRGIRPDMQGGPLALQIYVGVDRSDTVRFEATRDALNDGKYLFSKESLKTDAYIIGASSASKLTRLAESPSGFDRRVMLLDSSSSVAEVMLNEGTRALSDARETAIFDGSINEDISPYIFGVHYGLGDVVNLVGDYGLTTKARVTEYIRSKDSRGTKAYPTLTAIDSEGIS